jgi:hypothetical protein
MTEERQERLENESDATSLVQDESNGFSTDDDVIGRGHGSLPRSRGGKGGWFARFLSRVHYPGTERYQPVSQEHNQ